MEKAIFSRIYRFQHTSYADIEGMRENGYGCGYKKMAIITRGPSPSRSEDQRWAQKASLATHVPPPPATRVRERRGSERGKPSHSFLIPL